MDVSRYTDVTELSFEIEFITPTFLGGADGNAEIRTAPFKTGIRYWWRVLYGAKYGNKIKEVEDEIFGSTDKASNVQILFSGMNKNIPTMKEGFPIGKKINVTSKGKTFPINILDYLAYGKYEYVKGNGNVYNSTYIVPGSRIKVSVLIKKTEFDSEIKDALKMFILYGNVGSRSRNGFGSMDTSDLKCIKFSKNVKLSDVKEFPVLSKQTRTFRTKQGYDKWEDALSELGIIYKEARNSLESRHSYEKRGLVSRPIEVKGESIPDNIKKGRIPKFCYMFLDKNKEGKYTGHIMCLPILFYEKNKQSEYFEVYKKMIDVFKDKLEEDTKPFIKQFIGETK